MTIGNIEPAAPRPGPPGSRTDATGHRQTPAIAIRVDDRIPDMFGEYARQRIHAVARHCPVPIESIRIRLADHRESAVAHAFVAQADITASRPVRVQVTGATARDAVDALQARTRARLRTLSAPHHTPWDGHGVRAATLLYLRPAQERTIVRNKRFRLQHRTPAEAAVDMALMDYTFELFSETGTEVASVLYRTTHNGYRLIRLDKRSLTVTADSRHILVDPRPAPRLNRDQALTRLSLSGSPFLFYRDPDLDRGCVLYHRFDGHYGFMTSRQ